MPTATERERARSSLTVADLHRRLGPIALARIRMDPAPGTATEADLLAAMESSGRLFELVDGLLSISRVNHACTSRLQCVKFTAAEAPIAGRAFPGAPIALSDLITCN